MKIAYVTSYDASDIRNWSGLGLHIAQALQNESLEVSYIGSLKDKYSLYLKAKQYGYRLLGKKYLCDRSHLRSKGYAFQTEKRLHDVNPDVVFSPGTTTIAHLNCKQPIAFWTDATFASMIDFYSSFSNLPWETIQNGHELEQSALDRCSLAIYSSEWAATSAVTAYKADPKKIKVVPFGANIKCERTVEDIKRFIDAKPPTICSLLFLGVEWIRKGGPFALKLAEDLNKRGWKTELKIVGCTPPASEKLPPYVKVFGFIPKSTEDGRQQLNHLLESSHFLIAPSVAECTPIAFCEANSFGLPCLSTDVGGIQSVIRNDFNGKIFNINSSVEEYSIYIISVLSERERYRELALSSFEEYESRLNWKTAGKKVKTLLEELR